MLLVCRAVDAYGRFRANPHDATITINDTYSVKFEVLEAFVTGIIQPSDCDNDEASDCDNDEASDCDNDEVNDKHVKLLYYITTRTEQLTDDGIKTKLKYELKKEVRRQKKQERDRRKIALEYVMQMGEEHVQEFLKSLVKDSE